MSMTDIMSAMRLHLFAEVALALTLAAFVMVLVTVCLDRNRAAFERARALPLEDEPRPERRGEAGHE